MKKMNVAEKFIKKYYRYKKLFGLFERKNK